MNEGIELHDSVLEAITFEDASALVTLAPVYIHRGGCGWLQQATLRFEETVPGPVPTEMYVWISEGTLQTGADTYRNMIPLEGDFEGPIEFSLSLANGAAFEVRARRLEIRLFGKDAFLEVLPPNIP